MKQRELPDGNKSAIADLVHPRMNENELLRRKLQCDFNTQEVRKYPRMKRKEHIGSEGVADDSDEMMISDS
jgi:hypothetical protein